MIISLTGFMGCGKSSVGRKLSELLCCPFMDLDDAIVESAGRSIPEIFATEGEPAFRQMELEALKEMVPLPYNRHTSMEALSPTLILALGGGTVMTPECAEIVREETCCVYLKASIETLMEHLAGEADGRPMLANASSAETSTSAAEPRSSLQVADTSLRGADTSLRGAERRGNPLYDRITELMAQRSETYEKTAHIIVDTDGKSIEEIAQKILESIR